MQPIWVFPRGFMYHWVYVPLLQIPYQSHLDYYYETHIIFHIIEKKNVRHVLLTVILTSVLSRQFTCDWFTACGLNVYTVWGRHKKWPQEKWGYIRFGLSVIPSFCLSFCPSAIICFHSISWEQLSRIYPILYVHWYWLIFPHDLDWDFTHHFSDICTRVMTLDLRQNFVSAQYL